MCAALLVGLAQASLWPVRAVALTSTRHLDPQTAIAQSGLLGVPVFRASTFDARARLLALPALRDARVELSLPDGASVTLTEREAAGRWVAGGPGGAEWFVDASGVLFASRDASAAPPLRVVDQRAPTRSGGERLDSLLVNAALRLATLAPGELRADATALTVLVTPGADGLVLRATTRSSGVWEIRFGVTDRFDEKLALARRFLRENPDRRLDYVDVRSPDRIVFSPN